MNLTQYQKDFLYCPERFSVVEASTKAGKTQPHIYWLLMLSLNNDPVWNWDTVEEKNFWWVAPTFGQAEIAYKRMRSWIRHDDRFSIKHLNIETPLGSIINFKTADNPDSLYGEDVYGGVLDEFTRVKQDSYLAFYSTLTATKGPLKMIGNYKGEKNWGAKKAEQARNDKEYYYAKITAWEAVGAGILEEETVLQAQRDLHPVDFKALYLCEGSIDSLRLFEQSSILDLFTNDHVRRTGQKYLSADVAFEGSDKYVITIWDGLVCYKVVSIAKSTGREVVDAIKILQREHGISNSRIVYDGDGPGAALSGYMPTGAVCFHNGGSVINKGNFKNLKAQCYYELEKLTRNGEVYIHDHKYRDDITVELEFIRKLEQSDDGKLGLEKKSVIKKTLGYSPDFADSLAMRMYFEINKPKKYDLTHFTVSGI